MSLNGVISNNCRECARSTRHSILFEHKIASDEIFNERDTWRVVQCLGCLTIGFHHTHEDFDDVEKDAEGRIEHQVIVEAYPRVLSNHKGLEALYFLPPVIRKIYEQTLRALGEQANVLASIGLRACIEAVCNQLRIAAASLERRIDLLFKAGYVSNGDKKRLNAIRFLGNDAAHEIREPNRGEMRIALEIVEHLLKTVFILESRATGLELVAETYDDFLKLLGKNSSKHNTGKEISLVGLLGRQRRLVGQQLESFEEQLKIYISKNSINYINLGQTELVGGKEIQLYSIKPELADDDDIPF